MTTCLVGKSRYGLAAAQGRHSRMLASAWDGSGRCEDDCQLALLRGYIGREFCKMLP
jgi:hypothetical protein